MSHRVFPVQDSTLSADALAGRVVRNYSQPGHIVCRLYRRDICDTYKVTAEGREYYLKVYRHGRRTKVHVTEEVRLLNYLAGHSYLPI